MRKSMAVASALIMATLMACAEAPSPWERVDNFETGRALTGWSNLDLQNETDPFIESPQISELRREGGNGYMLRKPAADGVVGNRKAMGFKALTRPIAVGETATLYTRIYVESFPNNHSFGLSNLSAEGIAEQNYNAFEPMIRITDKAESNGDQNTGALMVLSGEKKTYANIQNPITQKDADPLSPGQWYEIWAVINNNARGDGGQRYDLYVRGGEFVEQSAVFKAADFRMRREQALGYFVAISNTGPKRAPYGNGGVRYDDIYLVKGRQLSTPSRD